MAYVTDFYDQICLKREIGLKVRPSLQERNMSWVHKMRSKDAGVTKIMQNFNLKTENEVTIFGIKF